MCASRRARRRDGPIACPRRPGRTPPREPGLRGHGCPRAHPRAAAGRAERRSGRRDRAARGRRRRSSSSGSYGAPPTASRIALRAAGQAVEDRDDADDLVARLAHRLDRLDRRAAGRDDVLDDQAAVARLEQRALDAALEAVRLVSLRTKNALTSAPPASAAHARRVGAHRQPADRGRPHARARSATSSASARKPAGPQDRALGVDVVLRRRAARQHDLADDDARGRAAPRSAGRGRSMRSILARARRLPAQPDVSDDALAAPRSAPRRSSRSASRTSCCSSTPRRTRCRTRPCELLDASTSGVGGDRQARHLRGDGRAHRADLARRGRRRRARSARCAPRCAPPAAR